MIGSLLKKSKLFGELCLGDDVAPDFGFADFVEDFVTHVGVESAYDILIAPLAEEIYGFIKMLFVDDAGVVGASDEEDGQIGIMQSPTLLVVGLIHELK